MLTSLMLKHGFYWVSIMNEKDKLIEMIKNHPTVIRYQKLEKTIHENSTLKEKLEALKTMQKKMVQLNVKQKKDSHIDNAYTKLLLEIESFPLLGEYLELQQEINNMLQQVAFIIENEINKEIS